MAPHGGASSYVNIDASSARVVEGNVNKVGSKPSVT